MIRGADWLCEKHFGKCLIDPGVEILDPATGTGTFIVELLEHFAGGGADKLRHKYKEELHANDVAILPYYVANLNIEATYAALTGHYAEFPNLCFVDTLDNTAGLGKFAGYSPDLFGSFSDENIGRIKRQNERKISVIIGNPPYNANQQNENDNNKNRVYAHIRSRVKETYISTSKARKTKTYDPYKEFFRWASDRIGSIGTLAFVTNRSYIDSKEGDGFRKAVIDEFDRLIVIDLGGDWKDKGRGGGTNVFSISTGVSIMFAIRDGSLQRERRRVEYLRIDETDAPSKLAWLNTREPCDLNYSLIRPDKKGNWFDQDQMPDSMIRLVDEDTKRTKRASEEQAIFKDYGLGISTNRDPWLIDITRQNLTSKTSAFIKGYESQGRDVPYDTSIKWSRNLKARFVRGSREMFDATNLKQFKYRPFTKRIIYVSQLYVDELGRWSTQFASFDQPAIYFSNGKRTSFATIAGNQSASLDLFLPNSTTIAARYRYLPSGERVDNVTDWAVAQFVARYPDAEVTKDAIFAYVYAALHDPVYRTTYAADLRREFPRIPLHDDFARWAAWGQALLDLHIGYEGVAPFPLTRVDAAPGKPPVPKLKSLPETGVIVLDSDTQLTGVPRAAWDYRLGNRSAIDWVLDQHKEKKIKDPTVARLFDTYRFADHKERVIDLLGRVVTVSLATVAITEAMAVLPRSDGSAAPGSVVQPIAL